jgi:hypothetical protein
MDFFTIRTDFSKSARIFSQSARTFHNPHGFFTIRMDFSQSAQIFSQSARIFSQSAWIYIIHTASLKVYKGISIYKKTLIFLPQPTRIFQQSAHISPTIRTYFQQSAHIFHNPHGYFIWVVFSYIFSDISRWRLHV